MSLIGWLVFFMTGVHSLGATVCEVLDHRLEQNGKDVEVVGHLGGTTYSGFLIYEKHLGAPCEYRWIFSWPSALGLFFEGQDGAKLAEEVNAKLWAQTMRYGAIEADVIVKGRLVTRSDYYVINLPWRPQRPLGRFSYGGVAGLIIVSDIKVKDTGGAPHP